MLFYNYQAKDVKSEKNDKNKNKRKMIKMANVKMCVTFGKFRQGESASGGKAADSHIIPRFLLRKIYNDP